MLYVCRPENLDAFLELETSFKRNKLQNALDQVEWNETLRDSFYDYIYGNATQYSYCFSDVEKVNIHYIHCNNVIISISISITV